MSFFIAKVLGILFYSQFIQMICELYHTTAPRGPYDTKQKWANSLWMEVDVEKSGSVNFLALQKPVR